MNEFYEVHIFLPPYGKFALVKPGFVGSIPVDAARIELHSSKAKMLGRVEIKGDPEGAVRFQQQFKVTALGTPLIVPPIALHWGWRWMMMQAWR